MAETLEPEGLSLCNYVRIFSIAPVLSAHVLTMLLFELKLSEVFSLMEVLLAVSPPVLVAELLFLSFLALFLEFSSLLSDASPVLTNIEGISLAVFLLEELLMLELFLATTLLLAVLALLVLLLLTLLVGLCGALSLFS